MHNKILVSSLVVVFLLTLAIPSALAQQTANISWTVIGSGGGLSTGVDMTLNGTLGQPVIGLSPGAWSDLSAGYWYVDAVQEVDLAIDKQALAANVTAGEALTYTITVTNVGPDAATGVEVLDLVPPGTRVVTATVDNPYAASEFCSLGGACSIGTLPGSRFGDSVSNYTPGQADGFTIARSVTLDPGDLLTGSTIADVDIAIEFEKIDHETCGNPYTGGNPYNPEIVFYLTSPSGTRVVLVENQNNWGGSGLGATYTSNSVYGGHVTVTFDDSAAAVVGGPAPQSGTFRPVRPLSALNGESPFGTWTLTVGDDAAGDALCFAGFDLTVEAVTDIKATINLVLDVNPDYTEDTLVNQAQVSAGAPDTDETNNIATVTTTVQTEADLRVAKTALRDEVCLGAYNIYEIEVTNGGPSDAQEVTVTDVLTGALIYGGSSPGCSAAGQTVTCSLERLAAGGSHSFLVTADLAPGVMANAWITNTATATSTTTDPNAVNNMSPEAGFTAMLCSLPEADLSIAKTMAPDPITAGSSVHVTLTVTNAGPNAAEGVIVQDLLPFAERIDNLDMPDGWSCDGGVTCVRAEPMPDSAMETFTFDLFVAPDRLPGSYDNLARVIADNPDPDSADNLAVYSYQVDTVADLSVDKIDLADPVGPLEGYLYQINVYNYGASDARDVVVVDTLSEGITYSSASPGCAGKPGGQVVTCTLDTLAAGEQGFFLLAVTAGDVPSGTVLLNDVVVSSATPDPVQVNNTDQETTMVLQEFGPSADLAIVKTALPAQVPAGELITYVLTVTNAGPLAATGVQVLELVPSDAELVSIVADNPDFAYEFCALAGVCYLGTVQPNSTIARVTAVLRVDTGCQAPSVTNMASVSGDQTDYLSDNNLDWAEVAILPAAMADLVLVKDATATTNVGDLITYTMTVWNLGPQPATGVLVTDTLPAGVTLASVDAGCGPAGNAIVCAAPLLEAGQALSFTLVVTVDANVEPGTSLENAASVGALATDPDPSNNVDTADTTVLALGWTDLVLDKTGPEWVLRNDVITYTVVVTNNGPSLAQSVDISDDLPEGVDLIAVTIQRIGEDPALCGGLICQVGAMAAGEVVTVTVVGRVQGDLPNGLALTNSAAVFSDIPEGDLLNNTDDHICWVHHYNIYLPMVMRAYDTRLTWLSRR